MHGLISLLPELSLLTLGLVLMGCEIFGSEIRRSVRIQTVTVSGLIIVLALVFCLPQTSTSDLIGLFQTTATTQVWKILFISAALLTVLLSRSYLEPGGNLRGVLDGKGPYFSLLVFTTLGMCVLISSREWLTFFLALELATLPLYALVGFQLKDSDSTEASAKFIVMGSLATAMTLFGISFLYGACGKLDFQTLASVAQIYPISPMLWIGALFLLAGLGFKLAMVPFHMWAPDVYEGAPTPVMAFLSVGSKSAAVAAMALIFLGPLDSLRPSLLWIFGGGAVLSMIVGNLGAFRQKRLRRFVAYSSIAQAGYLLLAFMGDPHAAQTSVLYNLFAYGATSFCFYFVIAIVGRTGDESFSSLRGLSRRNPAVALALLLAMFSLAGIPPLAGFMGKFLLFSTAANAGQYVLVLLALINAVVSFYYYMLVVKEAYITPDDGPSSPLALTMTQSVSLVVLSIMLLALGILPQLSRYLQDLP